MFKLKNKQAGDTSAEQPLAEEDTAAQTEELSTIPQPKHCSFSKILNKYFHHIDRGSSLKTEVTAGIFLCIMTVCGVFMNLQLLSSVTLTSTVANNGETVASMWFWAMMIAFAANLVIGLVARLPFVQVSGMGLTTVLMSYVGISSGLTYYNLLAICFVSSILYAVIVSVPFIRNFIYKAIPDCVKKAVPVAVGLLVAFMAIQLSGLVTFNSDLLEAYGAGYTVAGGSLYIGSLISSSAFSYTTDSFHPTLLLVFVFTLVILVLILILKARKAKHPYLWPLLIGTVGYLIIYVLAVCINWNNTTLSYDSLWGRAWMLGSEDTILAHMSAILSGFSFGTVFSEGFDFSGYGGSAALLFLTAMLSMTFVFLFQNNAVVSCAGEKAGFGEKEKKSYKIALMCNAGANIVGSFFGTSPVEISAENVGGADEGARSGIVPIVASIGFLISAFIWVIPAVFTTYTSTELQLNLYGHYGVVLELLTESGFAFVDAVMVIVGLSMVKHGFADIDWKDWTISVPFVATIAVAFFTTNIAYGVAAGCVISLIITLVKVPEQGESKLEVVKNVSISSYVVTAILLILLILALAL